jgi:hypothetical protein
MFGKAFAIWLLLLMLAVLNGSAREFLINPWIGQQPGHIVSTIILCLARLRGFDAKEENIGRTSGWIARDGVKGKNGKGL